MVFDFVEKPTVSFKRFKSLIPLEITDMPKQQYSLGGHHTPMVAHWLLVPGDCGTNFNGG